MRGSWARSGSCCSRPRSEHRETGRPAGAGPRGSGGSGRARHLPQPREWLLRASDQGAGSSRSQVRQESMAFWLFQSRASTAASTISPSMSQRAGTPGLSSGARTSSPREASTCPPALSLRPVSVPETGYAVANCDSTRPRRAQQDKPAVRRDRPALEIGGHLLAIDGWKIERERSIFGHSGRGALVASAEMRWTTNF